VSERCAWCGVDVDAGDGFRAFEPAGSRRAAFCRLEHVVPWAIRGAMWDTGSPDDDYRVTHCAWCEQELPEAHVLLVRSRGEHRVPDGLCSADHLLEWAKAGGRYR